MIPPTVPAIDARIPVPTLQEPLSFWKAAEYHAAAARLKLLERLGGEARQIDKEIHNLRSTMNWLHKKQDDQSARLLLSYVNLLLNYLHSRNYDAELEYWCEAGLVASSKLKINPAKLHLYHGEAQYALGRWGEAARSWQLAVTQSSGENSITYAQAIFAQGRLQMNQGEYQSGILTLRKAENLFTEQGDWQSVINVRSELASYYLNRRELDTALKLYLEIDQIRRSNGITETPDNFLLMLGVVYRQQKDYDKAIQYLSELYARSKNSSPSSSIATAAHHLAWTYLALGQVKEAQHLCGEALALYGEIQDPRGLSDGYEQFGVILFEKGRYKDAIRYFRRSGEMRRGVGNQPGLISSMRCEALGYLFSGNYIHATILAAKTLFLYFKLGLLSRERVVALSKDFFRYLKKAFHLRMQRNLAQEIVDQPIGSKMPRHYTPHIKLD